VAIKPFVDLWLVPRKFDRHSRGARLNNKVFADTDANRQMMESMLAPHEMPSASIYETVALCSEL
jgi:hypothetical protein